MYTDLVGKKFGALLVLSVISKNQYKYYKCKCDCGKIRFLRADYFKKYTNANKCTCYIRYKDILPDLKEKLRDNRIYRIWSSMHARCECVKHPNYSQYKNYPICKEWHNVPHAHPQQGFINFYKWAMSNGYTDELSLDRIDGTKGYNPENCRWVTIKEQNHNLCSNINIKYHNEIHCLAEWCKILKISNNAVTHCHNRYNLTWPEIFDRYTKQHFDIKKQAWIDNKTGEIVLKAKKAVNHCGSNMSSKEEDIIYNFLCQKFIDVKRRYYNDNVYPFACDFYISSEDLYIEYQGHAVHGNKLLGHKKFGPYNPNNIEHQKIYKQLIIKAETSDFYKTCLNEWTIRDPLKRETAQKNNLNWIEFFTMDEFLDWYESLD